jgi:uncharacterized C2H2 Zn-finger protein
MVRNIIKCSQCEMEFPSGVEYREHWEKVHFYPYLKNDSFDTKTALAEEQSKNIYKQ